MIESRKTFSTKPKEKGDTMITNLEEAKHAIRKIQNLNKKVDGIVDEYKEDIITLESQVQILKDERGRLMDIHAKELSELYDDLKVYIEANWKRDFGGKKSIEFPEGRLFVRSSTSIEIPDEAKVSENLLRLGYYEALKIKPNKTVLKGWSVGVLKNFGVEKNVKDKPGVVVNK